MKFHPRNGQIVARQLEDDEMRESGVELIVIDTKRPVLFVSVVEVTQEVDMAASATAGPVTPKYKKGDILAINPMLVIPMGWLAHNYLVFPEHQVLAVVEIEKDDNIKGEAWDRDNPMESKIIAPGGVC